LFLIINQTVYRVRAVRCDPKTAVRAFRLNKPDGTLYDVEQTHFGNQCDCPDFIFRRDGLDPCGCKHVKALVAEGLLDDGGTAQGEGLVEPTAPPARGRAGAVLRR
jgi:hypothetical protein